jgi:hypothetical protein
MIDFFMARREYTKKVFAENDPRYGLIWGSPEADNGDPDDDTPDAHLYYYQNSTWIWRGLKEHGRSLQRAGKEHSDRELEEEGALISAEASRLRVDIERSLRKTLEGRNNEMRNAGITPFSVCDTTRKPSDLSSYENHRYMMDWWTADWGDPDLDAGHFRHRSAAGMEILGMNVASDGVYGIDSGALVTSNFMEHGTLAARIRVEDYRPFLLTLYGNLCYAMDSGSRFAPEDAVIPGSYAGEGVAWGWSPVVNSELQPTLALRWLLCYEEHDREIVHLQKAAPKHWFEGGQKIAVDNCPTRFGIVSWTTESLPGRGGWQVSVRSRERFAADMVIHIHPPDRRKLRSTSLGKLDNNSVMIPATAFAEKKDLLVHIA